MYPIAVEKVAAALGGQAVLRRQVRTVADLASAIQDGLPREVVGAISLAATPEGSPLRVMDLVTSLATYKRSPKLSPQAGERAERLARITALATAVLEDTGEARLWLTAAHPLLGNRAPLEVASTDLGAREVERILHNIDHGLPA